MKNIVAFLIAFACSGLIMGQNIPVDFETGGFGASWTWTVFENDTNPALEIIPNPDPSGFNVSSTVAKFTALQAGQPFAGCETSHGAGIGSFTIDSSNYLIRIMVWKSVVSDVGIKLVRSDNWSLGEIKIPNTLTEEWEQLTFDFSAHFGNTYDQIVIFPDFNGRTSDEIIYFDNIYGPVGTAVGREGAKPAGLTVYPNPTSEVLRIRSEEPLTHVALYDLTGRLLITQDHPTTNVELDVAALPAGLYLLKTTLNQRTWSQEVIIQ